MEIRAHFVNCYEASVSSAQLLLILSGHLNRSQAGICNRLRL